MDYEIVSIPGCRPLMVCHTSRAFQRMNESGMLAVMAPSGKGDIVKYVLLPILTNHPKWRHIDWKKVFRISDSQLSREFLVAEVDGELVSGTLDETAVQQLPTDGGVHDQAVSRREFLCDYSKLVVEMVGDAKVDMNSWVDVETLSRLGLLPRFFQTCLEAMRKDLSRTRWTQGYNKKLDLCCGRHSPVPKPRNLLIIDCSWSIPQGVYQTMVNLADDLRTRTNAELILTSAKSYWFDASQPMPGVAELQRMLGRSNESAMFCQILEDRVVGRSWDNVICFGDNDAPWWHGAVNTAGTRVGKLWGFHTRNKRVPGYAEWAEDVTSEIELDSSWAKYVID